MSSKNANELTVNYTKVEVSRLSSTDLEENERSKGQKIAYPRYNHPTLGEGQALMVQLPWIKLESYGVPRAGEYYKNDSDRAFVKVPLNLNQPESKALADVFKSIDAHFSSEEFASKLLGSKWKKYEYQPIFRIPEIDEEEQAKKFKGKKQYPVFPYCKLKLDTDFKTGAIKTKVYKSELVDEQRKRTEVQNLNSVDEFAGVVKFLSNFRPIVRMTKFWAQPLTNKNPTWGVTLKIIKAEVEPSQQGNSLYTEYMNSDSFLDDDSKVEQSKVAQVESDDEDSKNKTQAQVDSDDSDSDEPPKNVQASNDDSDDSESEEKPKPAETNKVSLAPKKVVQAESDDDSDDSDAKPVATNKKPAPAPAKPAGRSKGKSANA